MHNHRARVRICKKGFTQAALSGEYDTHADKAFRFLSDRVTSHIMHFDGELVAHLKTYRPA